MTGPRAPADPFPPSTVSRPDYLLDGSDAWFRRVLYRFIQSADRLQRCREGFGQEAGLTGNQYIVLMGVSYLGQNGGVTIAALAAHVGLAAPHVTTEVGRLLRRGLLHKRPNHEDKRSVLVSLTDAGRDLVRDVIEVVTPTNDLLFNGIDRAELETLLAVSEKLVRNAEVALAHLRVLNDQRAAARSEGQG